MHDVMGVYVFVRRAARKAATLVSPAQCAPDGRRDAAGLAADVEGRAGLVLAWAWTGTAQRTNRADFTAPAVSQPPENRFSIVKK